MASLMLRWGKYLSCVPSLTIGRAAAARSFAAAKESTPSTSTKHNEERSMEQLKSFVNTAIGAHAPMPHSLSRQFSASYLEHELHGGRKQTLLMLAKEFSVDSEKATLALDQAIAKRGSMGAGLGEELRALREALEPRYERLLDSLNHSEFSSQILLTMREDLLSVLREERSVTSENQLRREEVRALEDLEASLKKLLSGWFGEGFLRLDRVTWETCTTSLMEHLMAMEAVHQVNGWPALKQRMGIGRRCFAFFHSSSNLLPTDVPLVFIYAALTASAPARPGDPLRLPSNLQDLLQQKTVPSLDLSGPEPLPERDADTAVFYSITSSQAGLKGIDLGNAMIKHTCNRISRDMPWIVNFATLSPLPGFMTWLRSNCKQGYRHDELFLEKETSLLKELAVKMSVPQESSGDTLLSILARPGWHQNRHVCAVLKPVLVRLGAKYLVNERRNGAAVDPVANFHLRNGARVEQLHWLADTSPNGISKSAGLMVNYLYVTEDVDRNNRMYLTESAVTASEQVKALLCNEGCDYLYGGVQASGIKKRPTQSSRVGKKAKNRAHPRIEPGPRAPKARILPLN